jgi:hypothetical protein
MLMLMILITMWISCTANVLMPQGMRNQCRPGLSQPVIVYSTRGGLTGTNREWSLFQDGTVCSAEQYRGKLSDDSIRRLLDEASAARFFFLKSNYGGSTSKLCHQCIFYKVTVQNGRWSKTVETHDGAKEVPKVLWELLSHIQSELRSLR